MANVNQRTDDIVDERRPSMISPATNNLTSPLSTNNIASPPSRLPVFSGTPQGRRVTTPCTAQPTAPPAKKRSLADMAKAAKSSLPRKTTPSASVSPPSAATTPAESLKHTTLPRTTGSRLRGPGSLFTRSKNAAAGTPRSISSPSIGSPVISSPVISGPVIGSPSIGGPVISGVMPGSFKHLAGESDLSKMNLRAIPQHGQTQVQVPAGPATLLPGQVSQQRTPPSTRLSPENSRGKPLPSKPVLSFNDDLSPSKDGRTLLDATEMDTTNYDSLVPTTTPAARSFGEPATILIGATDAGCTGTATPTDVDADAAAYGPAVTVLPASKGHVAHDSKMSNTSFASVNSETVVDSEEDNEADEAQTFQMSSKPLQQHKTSKASGVGTAGGLEDASTFPARNESLLHRLSRSNLTTPAAGVSTSDHSASLGQEAAIVDANNPALSALNFSRPHNESYRFSMTNSMSTPQSSIMSARQQTASRVPIPQAKQPLVIDVAGSPYHRGLEVKIEDPEPSPSPSFGSRQLRSPGSCAQLDEGGSRLQRKTTSASLRSQAALSANKVQDDDVPAVPRGLSNSSGFGAYGDLSAAGDESSLGEKVATAQRFLQGPVRQSAASITSRHDSKACDDLQDLLRPDSATVPVDTSSVAAPTRPPPPRPVTAKGDSSSIGYPQTLRKVHAADDALAAEVPDIPGRVAKPEKKSAAKPELRKPTVFSKNTQGRTFDKPTASTTSKQDRRPAAEAESRGRRARARSNGEDAEVPQTPRAHSKSRAAMQKIKGVFRKQSAPPMPQTGRTTPDFGIDHEMLERESTSQTLLRKMRAKLDKENNPQVQYELMLMVETLGKCFQAYKAGHLNLMKAVQAARDCERSRDEAFLSVSHLEKAAKKMLRGVARAQQEAAGHVFEE